MNKYTLVILDYAIDEVSIMPLTTTLSKRIGTMMCWNTSPETSPKVGSVTTGI